MFDAATVIISIELYRERERERDRKREREKAPPEKQKKTPKTTNKPHDIKQLPNLAMGKVIPDCKHIID